MSYDLDVLRKQYNDLAGHKIFVTSMPLDSEYVACISLPVFKAILDALERIPELEQVAQAVVDMPTGETFGYNFMGQQKIEALRVALGKE